MAMTMTITIMPWVYDPSIVNPLSVVTSRSQAHDTAKMRVVNRNRPVPITCWKQTS